jgi:RimJ/RimL family protein N-acetyltransferase
MQVLETDRLLLRWLSAGDARFILELVNEPAWLRYIGDRGVKSLQDAEQYIANGPVAMYHRLGFSLYLVALKSTEESIGICGLLKRPALDEVDLGFALLERFRGKGYAYEAASAVMSFGTRTLGLTRILAITAAENPSSDKLLGKLGFRFERMISLTADSEVIRLYSFGSHAETQPDRL